MPSSAFPRLAVTALIAGGALAAIFAGLLLYFRDDLREEIRRKIVERDAAVLQQVALQELAEAPAPTAGPASEIERLIPVLRSARQKGILGVVVFDRVGMPVRAVPASLLYIDLPLEDLVDLAQLKPISRYHPAFRFDHALDDLGGAPDEAPVLEVLLPLHDPGETKLVGVVRYHIDARALAGELALIDRQISHQTGVTLGAAWLLIALVVGIAYLGLRRAQRQVTERNERLVRANLELTFAAKTSALGQITSHLVHGLQGPVAGLRALVANRETGPPAAADWENAFDYTERMQAMIQEAVALLSDVTAHASYEFTGAELAAAIHDRNADAAHRKGVNFTVRGAFAHRLDSHRGGLICLIANNLLENAIEATPTGRNVAVVFSEQGAEASVVVADEGPGIPLEIREHLFKAGRTGRTNGTGLGLALAQSLARQIGATLQLESTGSTGTLFRLSVPLASSTSP